jgi:hypothetical protein
MEGAGVGRKDEEATMATYVEEGIEVGKHVRTAIPFFDELRGGYNPRDFAIRLWEGTHLEAEAGQPAGLPGNRGPGNI